MPNVSALRKRGPTQIARWYFLTQAVSGLLWWAAVFLCDDVRRWTLGAWQPGVLVVPDLVLFVGASGLAAVLARHWPAVTATVWSVCVTVGLVAQSILDRVGGWGAIAMTLASAGSVVATVTLVFGRLPREWFFVGPFRFHPAPERSRGGHVARSLAQLVVFWSMFLVILPLVLGWFERRMRVDWPLLDSGLVMGLGVATFGVGSVIGLWACLTMATLGEGTPLPAETARQLVIAGPYRLVRNPMAVAGAIQTVGIGLWISSWIVVVSAAAGGFVWNTYIRPDEEADLAARFGAPYGAYRDQVRCWVPIAASCARELR